MDENSVICTNIHKTYGKGVTVVHALRGVDLEVKKKEVVMIVGPSGSGKTTLLSVLSSILTQDEGECFLFGTNVNRLQEHEKVLFRRDRVGFVFQSFNLIPMLTAEENAAIPLLLQGMDKDAAIMKAKERLTQMGLGERIGALPPQMSGGEQQRVAIARCCIHTPDLIVCDEPTSALDIETGAKILELLKNIALEQNAALIVVTHDQRIFRFADRLLRMEEGKIVGTFTNSTH